ncbi:MAG TPA: phosphotransferase [Streptosporangiaceae bacterium]|nr:phosphotransferase [Streptosporangiaceae bacterium]
MTESHLLEAYLAVVGAACGEGDKADANLRRGQFHDVVLLGEVAYRFPRDEESRRLLPARMALLRALRTFEMPVAIPGLLSDAAVAQPLGQCHAALQRVSGEPIEPDQLAETSAQSGVITDLAVLLDRLLELGTDPAIQEAVPRADPSEWQRFADDVSKVLFPLMSRDGRARAEAELNRVVVVDPTGEALVHGDLGGSNLLWTGSGSETRLTGILDWDGAHLGNQADDLASIAVTVGWPLAKELDAKRRGGQSHVLADAKAIAATFALQQALPAALSGDKLNLDDGLTGYRKS